MTPHAHRPIPDRLALRDVAGFLAGLAMAVVWVVLVLASGPA